MMTTIPIQQTSIISSYSTKLTKQTSNVTSSEQTSNAASSNSNSQQTETLSLSDIAEKYDVENISPQEVVQLSRELYQNGYISLLTHGIISSQPEVGTDFEGILAQQTGADTQTRNYLQEWKDQLEIKGLSHDEIAMTKEVISLLENLKALS